jgi:HD-GYP domain-containing protein (c-di-GMP phosphodiesterase class II)
MSCTVAVDELSVGMYIHLEGGWLSHPFPLSSFRISAPEQIATLRGLGLARVRWVPEKSDPPPAVPPAAGLDIEAAGGALGAAAGTCDGPAADGVAPDPAAQQGEASPAAQRRRELSAQRESLLRCERQYGEAAVAWREAAGALATRPQHAGRTGEALAQAMLEKMLGREEMGIRLVAGGGDRAAAHALNVGVVAMLIGRSLGLPGPDMLDVGVGALMHDVGKQDMAERYHHADEHCSPSEAAAYRDHVARGVAQGRRMALSAGALAVLAQHHEHADGSGFPRQITTDQMSLAARIVAIVNRYDNLCNPAARRAALTPHEAVATLFAQGRQAFDATVLNAFIRVVGVYPAGSLVQLTDDRYAMVVAVNSSRPLKPRVLVHDPQAPRNEALVVNLEQAGDLGIRRSLPAAKLPAAALAYLDPRPRVSYFFEPLAAEADSEETAA